MKIFKTIVFFSSLVIAFSFTAMARADTFNPNNIISDFEILDYTTMDLNDITEFLISKNSYLASYSCLNPDGKLMSAAEIIYDRAVSSQVNPKFILVLLQKEQSLIEDPNPDQDQLDWATGYGCPDGGSCNQRWLGFWKQVNSASLQFKDYLDNPQLYTYKAGNTYVFTNPYGTISKDPVTVTPMNQATAALYNYTPHVYNGNYNFYKIWQRYFTINYLDGSLLQAEGEDGVWLIQGGKKRAILSKSVLLSRFDQKKIVTVNKSDLDKYIEGAPIKFPQYSLIISPRGTIFLLVDDKKRGFTSSLAFKKMGYNPDEVIKASWDDINSYADGVPITATSTYPTGALLQDKKTGGVYWVFEGTKAPLLDKIFLTTKFKNKKIIKTSETELAQYITVDPVTYGDGDLLKSVNANGIFVIANDKKRPITSAKVFEDLGYKWENVITVPPQVLYLYELGDPIIQVVGQTASTTSI